MDTIMFEAQRHGRLSFYMVSAGEEAVTVGSAAALGPDDVITCQYRETGVFQQRGFTLHDFMSQLTSNRNDPGKGRNMPVHYSGKKKVGAVWLIATRNQQQLHLLTKLFQSIRLHLRSEPRFRTPQGQRMHLKWRTSRIQKSLGK